MGYHHFRLSDTIEDPIAKTEFESAAMSCCDYFNEVQDLLLEYPNKNSKIPINKATPLCVKAVNFLKTDTKTFMKESEEWHEKSKYLARKALEILMSSDKW